MEQTKEIGSSPDRILNAQKNHLKIDPGCANLSREEIVKWHPVGGITWEERAKRMKAAGIINPDHSR